MTYPNVLILDYLKSTGQAAPEVEMTAERYIALGYQRLLTFEVDGGGFSLFGQPPAELMLSAYGLMEINDMAQVYEVDPAFIERIARWLFAQQDSDGSWGEGDLLSTAYVSWALAEAGYGDSADLRRGLGYLKEFLGQVDDPYLLAVAVNALVATTPEDGFTRQALEQLDRLKVVDGDWVYWPSGQVSLMGARGATGSIETTALAAYAMIRAQLYPQSANGALRYLVANKDSFGTWYSTQATILSLKALLLSVTQAGGEGNQAIVRVSLNGEETEPIVITPANADVVHLVTFTDKARLGQNRVKLDVEGEGNLMYQITSDYYLPWELAPEEPVAKEAMAIEVSYDRQELEVNDEVTATVQVSLLEEGMARMVLVDLGLPPGFAVLSEDLSALVETGQIARYELTGRQIIIYLEDFSSEEPLTFSYRLRAKYPLKAKAPLSTAYDYYNPATSDLAAPQEFVVRE